jgi:hypothetical protein
MMVTNPARHPALNDFYFCTLPRMQAGGCSMREILDSFKIQDPVSTRSAISDNRSQNRIHHDFTNKLDISLPSVCV